MQHPPRLPAADGTPGSAAAAALLALVLVGLALLAGPRPAQAAPSDPGCISTDYRGTPASAGAPIRFGDDPELAGDAGPAQLPAVPLDDARVLTAVQELRPPGKALVQRLNRLFESDGDAGIARFQATVARFDRAGLDSEIQVRYHPTRAQEGDLAAWTGYVRHVVDVFGPDPHVLALTITNEVNLPVSQNTSDGAYARARDALIQGIVAARDEADRKGFGRLRLGFTYAYRSPQDNDFWSYLGSHGTPAFRQALDWVGLDLYPGSVFPPVVAPGSYGAETVQALGTLRRCLMPMAHLTGSTQIWVTENGYASAPAPRSPASQQDALSETVRAVCDHSTTFGVTDYRYFNLRDNNSSGGGLFSADGLLRDDSTPKPSFATYRSLVASCGAAAVGTAGSRASTGRPTSSAPGALSGAGATSTAGALSGAGRARGLAATGSDATAPVVALAVLALALLAGRRLPAAGRLRPGSGRPIHPDDRRAPCSSASAP